MNFIATTKHQQQNNDQTSASKSYLKINFKILTKPCAQSLNKNLTLLPNLTFRICTKLLPTRFSSSTSATLTTSTSFELSSSHARVKSIKFTKQEWVSESVSQWVTDKHSQWSDSGPIKIREIKSKSLATTKIVFAWQKRIASLEPGGSLFSIAPSGGTNKQQNQFSRNEHKGTHDIFVWRREKNGATC